MAQAPEIADAQPKVYAELKPSNAQHNAPNAKPSTSHAHMQNAFAPIKSCTSAFVPKQNINPSHPAFNANQNPYATPVDARIGHGFLPAVVNNYPAHQAGPAGSVCWPNRNENIHNEHMFRAFYGNPPPAM